MAIVTRAQVLVELGIAESAATAAELAIIDAAIIKATGAVKRHLRYDPEQRSHTEYYPQMDYSLGLGKSQWEVTDTQAVLRSVSEGTTNELYLQHIPIRATPAIDLRIDYDGRSGTASGAFAAGTLKVEGVDFWPNYDGIDSASVRVCRDGVLRSIGLWPTEAGSVRVVYTAGYTATELAGTNAVIDASPIWDATLEETLRRAKRSLVLWAKNSRIGHVAGPLTSERLGDYSYSADASAVVKLVGGGFDITSESREKLEAFQNWGYNLAP